MSEERRNDGIVEVVVNTDGRALVDAHHCVAVTTDYGERLAGSNLGMYYQPGRAKATAKYCIAATVADVNCVSTGSNSVSANVAGHQALCVSGGRESISASAVNADAVSFGEGSAAVTSCNGSAITFGKGALAAVVGGGDCCGHNNYAYAGSSGSVAMVLIGHGGMAAGVIGSWLIFGDFENRNNLVSVMVDGDQIKPNVFYTVSGNVSGNKVVPADTDGTGNFIPEKEEYLEYLEY